MNFESIVCLFRHHRSDACRECLLCALRMLRQHSNNFNNILLLLSIIMKRLLAFVQYICVLHLIIMCICVFIAYSFASTDPDQFLCVLARIKLVYLAPLCAKCCSCSTFFSITEFCVEHLSSSHMCMNSIY